ncbi:MAG: hypothetical protein Kow0068_18470 [Marinilabiliales bacterium]
MIKLIYKIFLFLLMFIPFLSKSQGDLDSLLDKTLSEAPDYTVATFKTTRIVTCHSIERTQQYDLDFRITHRFGSISGGAYELFGLDHSTSCFEFDYGIFNWLMAGFSRSTFEKTYHGFLKFSLLRQAKGKKNIPLSVSLLTGIYINSLKFQDTTRTNYFTSRLSYINQLLIARKFNNRLSLQLSPTMIHRNLVENKNINNDIFSVGFGGRYKITNRTSINFEYFWIYNRDKISINNNTNPLSIGFDIETGSHVFQIYLTNDAYITENAFLGNCINKWQNGELLFGFSITRIFTLSSKTKEYESLGL